VRAIARPADTSPPPNRVVRLRPRRATSTTSPQPSPLELYDPYSTDRYDVTSAGNNLDDVHRSRQISRAPTPETARVGARKALAAGPEHRDRRQPEKLDAVVVEDSADVVQSAQGKWIERHHVAPPAAVRRRVAAVAPATRRAIDEDCTGDERVCSEGHGLATRTTSARVTGEAPVGRSAAVSARRITVVVYAVAELGLPDADRELEVVAVPPKKRGARHVVATRSV
jgi:hypothetical protein